MKKHAVRIAIGLVLTFLLLLNASGYMQFPFISRLEALSYDLRLNLSMPGTLDPRIAIIDIDEKSLAEEGRWPWSRDRLAMLIDNLFDRYHVAVVGFDVVFAEEDTSSGIKVLEGLAKTELKNDENYCRLIPKLRKDLNYDARFGSRLKERPVVMGYYFNDSEKGGRLPPPVLTADAFQGRKIPFISKKGYGANLPELQQCASGAGHFTPFVDPDGVCRRVPMLIEFGGNYYESLSLAMVRTLFGSPPITPVFGEKGGANYQNVEALRLSDLSIPVDEKVCALIPYRGRQGVFQYFSAADVLHGRISPDKLEGAIVLVGATAPGLMDLRSTPVSEVYPGVEIHANMIAGMLDQDFRHRPAYTRGAEMVILLVSGLLLSLALPALSPLRSMLLTAGTTAAVIGINVAAWHNHMVLPITAPLLLIFAVYVLNMIYGFFSEARAKRRITGLFGQYVPPELVKEMSVKAGEFSMQGESREMTVLFSDVRNFTTISEGLEPTQLTRMMNEYLTPMTQIIHRHRGTVDKYIGDAVMAFWGAPLADEQHARNAILAAIDMQREMSAMRARFSEKGWPEFHIGVGLSTGIMNVGNMGSEFRRAYTVMGDTVNLGSRLEGLTKHYGVQIIVSEATCAAVSGIVFRELDRVRVKGKEEPIAIFEPVGPEGEVDDRTLEEIALFAEGVRHYRAQAWDDAERLIARLTERSPSTLLYSMYLERIVYFRNEPPGSEWDGVFRFKSK